jgi:ubiquinone/menaquinone biosynthesis C-methylase UbiE
MDDSWLSGDPYDYYMGRWSSRVAELFTDWLSLSPGLEWLDIGCGSGALSETILNKQKPERVTAIDQSEGFVKTAQKRLGNRANCRVGNAFDLPLENASVNAAISGLVLNFLPEPEKALIEMKRVTTPGGSVAVYVWDYAGKMDLLNYFWDTAVELNPKAINLHEGRRFPGTDSEGLKDIFKRAGFLEIETAPLEINTDFSDFDDYWQPFLGGQGPAPTYVLSLDESERDKLRHALLERLAIRADGSIPMVARAWAAKSIVEE